MSSDIGTIADAVLEKNGALDGTIFIGFLLYIAIEKSTFFSYRFKDVCDVKYLPRYV